jgi:hypothetical protein
MRGCHSRESGFESSEGSSRRDASDTWRPWPGHSFVICSVRIPKKGNGSVNAYVSSVRFLLVGVCCASSPLEDGTFALDTAGSSARPLPPACEQRTLPRASQPLLAELLGVLHARADDVDGPLERHVSRNAVRAPIPARATGRVGTVYPPERLIRESSRSRHAMGRDAAADRRRDDLRRAQGRTVGCE